MKKKFMLAIGMFALILSITIGGTRAAFQADGEEATTEMSTTSLDISLVGDTSQVTFDNLVANETVKKQISVKNIKETSLYTRVSIKKYWLNSDGEKDFNESASRIGLRYNKDEWMEEYKDENGEEIVLYYRTPLTQDQTSANFLEGISVPGDMGNIEKGKKFAMDIQVDAIQSYNAKDAMLSQWGVLATFDDNGQLTGIER